MKRNPLTLLAFILGLAFVAVPAAMAGDQSRDSRSEARNVQQKSYAKSCCRQSRCDRRCQRLVQMLRKRGCSCPSALQAVHPVRAHTYLSDHYPPFRYSR